ncbi:carboxylate--amine ligase [Salinimonas sediminis]|uniref:ATP-dependent carboxylate-amine ligase n=1 Tax=Salinimonas sediminis TaxID=2303538 RepID=A0A346NP81_9ALTE|nr:ATP-grasp domain-containing protein [Salinimonas sediminis]AXR07338.1 ATP-dependent carboxylate-amine ligase [Salinimonas sediminis]
MEKTAVLIFDAAQRSALAATRALGKRSDIVVFTTDCTIQALAGCSRYSSQYLQCPNPNQNSAAFVAWVAETITRYNIDFLLPVTEVTSRTLVEHKQQLPPCKLPFADHQTLLDLSNKTALTQLAHTLNVPVPASQYCETPDQIDWDAVQFPCVLKPALSKVLVNNVWLVTQVHIVHSRTEMAHLLTEKDYFTAHPFMVQQYIDGQGAGIFCYYQHGQAKAFFAHKRLREKPPSGGVSVLSESAAVNPLMKQHAQALLTAVNWHGAAMVEFKIASDGTPYLMEINTRLWGSLQLSIDAGVNFPALLFDGEYRTLTEQPGFTHGVQLRWLLGDVDNLYLQLKDKQTGIGGKLAAVGHFLLPKFSGRRHEVNRLDDMGPFWFELKNYF